MFVEAVWADRVFLNSGACYDGEIISHDERELTIKLDIGQLTINNSDIKSVQIEKRPADETVKSGLSKDTLIIDGLRRKALQINTYRCKMRTEINDGSALSGTVFFKLPDKVRADGMVASNVQDIGRMEIKMVSDGNIFWLYYPQMNMVYRQPAEAKNSISPGMDEF